MPLEDKDSSSDNLTIVDSTDQVSQGQSNNEGQRNLNQMDVGVKDTKKAAGRKKWKCG